MKNSVRPRTVVGLFLATSILLTSGCAGTRDSGSGDWVEVEATDQRGGQSVMIAGTVRYLDLEGGLYVIRDGAGTQYNPINLPESFRKDGLLIEAEAVTRDDMASIAMVGPLVEVRRIRERVAAADSLDGTAWRLEDLSGTGVIDAVQATLAFSDGAVEGNGSCNRFSGTVEVDGTTITFGPLATTRRACPAAVMNQETRYLAALKATTRYELNEPFLFLHGSTGGSPLRFIRAD